MSSRFFGIFVSDGINTFGHPRALVGYRVSLRGSHALAIGHEILASTVIDDENGIVELSYRSEPGTLGLHRKIEFIVEDVVGRRIPFNTADGTEVLEDVDADELKREADFVVREADATGLLVTLGTGKTSIQSPNGFGWGFAPGNRITLLMDEDAFRHAAALFRNARQAIAVSQLFFPLPDKYDGDATKKQTKLIFDFAGTQPTAQQPRAAGAGAGDGRPERLLIDAADRGVDVRLVLNDVKIPLFVKIAIGLLVFPFAGTDGIAAAMRFLDEHWTDTDEVNRYFGEAAPNQVRAVGFKQPVAGSAGVMHAKLVVADWTDALSIGSPFGQSYFDTHDHVIEEPVRGGSDGFPKHDAGFAMSGPAVAHLQETIKLMWDTVQSADPMISFPGPASPAPPAPAPVPAAPPADGPPPGEEPLPRTAPSALDAAQQEDGVCGVQIVRTLSAGRFENVPGIPADGEKGILEAYQRAIAAADDFVYIETQYFTNDAIGDALVGAIKAKRNRAAGTDGVVPPDLQVIVVCNIAPDVPFYPFKQRRMIHRIREAIGEDPKNPKWFGVFTRWSHDVPADSPRPRLLPIYVHAKAAVVDDRWATVGSANLDGLSLDSMILWDALNGLIGHDLFRQQRAIEVNGCFINDDKENPNPVPDRLRRKLWAEHLGYRKSAGDPDLDAPDLGTRPAGGWLSLWTQRAQATLQSVTDNPKQSIDGLAQVLPWPAQNTTYKTPRKHLDALGVKTYKVVPLRSTRKFDFAQGVFDPKSRVEMDYD